MALIFDAFFSAVALAHFSVDVLNGQTSVLLAYLSAPLGLSNTAIGLVSTAYTIAGSLTQPLFGLLSDRVGPRWVVAGGVLWMAAFFSLGLVIPGRLALGFLVLAALGSSAFHPAGTMQATARGRQHYAGRETTSTSLFFLFGQAGLFLGPFVGGLLLASLGPPGLLALTALALPVAAYALRHLDPGALTMRPAAGSISGGSKALSISLGTLGAFALLAGLRAWVQQSMIVFVPKHLSDLGVEAGLYGMIAALFMGGSALGNVAGGNLADRLGKRRVAAATLALASLPIFLLSGLGWSPWLYLLIPLAGALSGASHSIVVVYAQKLIPGRVGLASGLILGFMFSSGALGALVSGYLADQRGMGMVFLVAGLTSLGAALFTYPLRED